MYKLIDSDSYHLANCNCTKVINNTIRVIGRGIISVEPDSAEVIIGVITQDELLSEAQEENSRVTNDVINSINEIGVLPKYIQTQDYNIRSVYDYIDGKQVFRAYEVSNYLKVTIKNIDIAGEVIDTAVKNGANSISGINFIVSDRAQYYSEALRLAVEDAKNKAIVISKEINVSLNDIPIEVNEQNSGLIAPLSVATFKGVGEGVPIEAGQNKINAEIEAVFIYN